jgi:hypothetical protein
MAKKPTNKSAVVREYLAANPKMGPTELSELIKSEKRLTVPPTFISNISSREKAKRKPKATKRTKSPPPDTSAVQVILLALDLIDAASGPEKAKLAIDTADEIRRRIR